MVKGISLSKDAFDRTEAVVHTVELDPAGLPVIAPIGADSNLIRGLKGKNMSGEVIPANSVARITAVNATDSRLLEINKPNADNMTEVVIVPRAIAVGGTGQVLMPGADDRNCRVTVTGTPSIGDELGTSNGVWTMAKDNTGFKSQGVSGVLSYLNPFNSGDAFIAVGGKILTCSAIGGAQGPGTVYSTWGTVTPVAWEVFDGLSVYVFFFYPTVSHLFFFRLAAGAGVVVQFFLQVRDSNGDVTESQRAFQQHNSSAVLFSTVASKMVATSYPIVDFRLKLVIWNGAATFTNFLLPCNLGGPGAQTLEVRRFS